MPTADGSNGQPPQTVRALKVRLLLEGTGSLDGLSRKALKSFVAEKGTKQGYGFIFDYHDGLLTMEMEKAKLAPNALGADPVGRFENDLGVLVGILPQSFDIRFKAKLTIRGEETDTVYNFRLSPRRQLDREVTVETADAWGSSSDERSLWCTLNWRQLLAGGLIAALVAGAIVVLRFVR